MATEINLIGGFYKSKTLPWSAQDVVNWLPVKSLSGGTRSPYKLRGLPGLRPMTQSIVTSLQILGAAPNGEVGEAYTFTYTATGGVPPYAFSFVSGSLPDGLTFSNGTISGTPTTVQTTAFSVVAIDAESQQSGRDDDIAIIDPGAPLPILVEIVPTSFGSNTTSHAASYPATVNAGDLIIFAVCARPDSGVPTITTPSGFTSLGTSAPPSSPPFRMSIFYRVASGAEGGTTVDFVTSIGSHMAAVCYRIQAGTYAGVPTASVNVLSPRVNPLGPVHDSGGDTEQVLFITGFGANSAQTPITWPFADNQTLCSSGGTNLCGVTSATTINTTGILGDLEAMDFFLPVTTNFGGFTISVRPA